MANFKDLKAFTDKIPRTINIAELLEIIHVYQVKPNQVIFIPLFSIKPNNTLIEDIHVSDSDITIGINISKLPLFSFLTNHYIGAEKNNQHYILNLIIKTVSNFLHSYFYGLNLGYIKKTNNNYPDSSSIYSEFDTIKFSVCTLAESLRFLLSDYKCFFNLEKKYVKEKTPNYNLNINSILNAAYLNGDSISPKPILNIMVILNHFTERVAEQIIETVKNNYIYKKLSISLKIKLVIISQQNNLNSFLPISLGNSTLKTSRETLF